MILFSAALAGCAGERDDAGATGLDSSGASGEGSGGSGSSAGSDGSGDAAGSDGGGATSGGDGDDDIRLDVGAGETEGGSGGEGGQCNPDTQECSCTAADLLFVIDNSVSMDTYQAALAGAFPSFVDAMYDNLPPGTDIHVGVTSTDFNCGSMGCSCSEGTSNCASSATEQEILDHYDTPDEFNNGGNGSQGRFFENGGIHYFEGNTDEDPTPLRDWFTATATGVGTRGCSFEMLSAGAAYAAHPANEPTNGGFFRDAGAVLIIIILSDEPDKSPEDVAVYHDMIVAKKQACGGDRCVVTAGLLDPCLEMTNQKAFQFLSSFGDAPILGSIADTANYSATVGAALAEVIGETCEDLPPIG